MKFVLVEDQVMFRTMLKDVLVKECAGEMVFEAGNVADVRSRMDELAGVDLLLLDVRLPDGDGVEFLDELTQAGVSVPVLLLSSSCDDVTVRRVSRGVARGFVHKDDDPRMLLMAIETVVSGGAYFSKRYRAKLEELNTGSKSFDKLLSRREQQLLRFFGQGYSDVEIAPMVGVTKKTVEVHRYNVMTKLGLHTAQELQAYALKIGLTTVEEL